jgi:hypothetical protein
MMGVDCDYCLIAARLITLLVAALLLLAPMHGVPRAARCGAGAAAADQRHMGRGPPVHGCLSRTRVH